jgi:alpha-acetolactate decarboxylase
MNTSNDIDTRIGTFKKINDTIGEITFKGTIDATVEEAKELTQKMNQLMNNQPYYLVNYLSGDLGSFPPEIWHYLGTDKEHNAFIEGSIVVTKSIGYKMQINVFFKKYTPNYPKNIVDTKEEAYAWIEKLKQFRTQ